MQTNSVFYTRMFHLSQSDANEHIYKVMQPDFIYIQFAAMLLVYIRLFMEVAVCSRQ